MKRYTPILAASLMLAVFAPTQTRAADNTWINGSTDFLWNGTSLNWASPTTWVDGDNAIFGATGAGTVNLGAPVTAHSLTFNAGGYVIQGGGNALTLAGPTPTIPTITANATITNATTIEGTEGLTFQGTGSLWLQDDGVAGNHYTGGTHVKSGTLILKNQKATTSGSDFAVDSIESLDAGATVMFGTLPATVDGTNYYDRSVNGQIPIGGSVVTAHNLNLTGGTFDVNGEDNLNQVPMPSGTGTILNSSVLSRGVLKFTGYGDTRTFSGVVMDGGPVTNSPIVGKLAHRTEVDFQNGTGTIILAGSNSFTGFIRIGPANCTIQLSGAGTMGWPSSENCPARQVIQNNGVIDLNGTSQKTGFFFSGANGRITNSAIGTLSTLTLCFNCTNLTAPANSGIISSIVDDPAASGLIGITKEGIALQNLNGAANNYHGDTVVNNGTLRIDQPGAISPNSAYRLSTSQGTLELNYAGDALVRKLYINGVEKAAGTYGPSTAPITGTGTVTVPPPNIWNNLAGNFLWDLTSANWTAPTTWVDGASAIFGATGAGTVKLASPITAQDLTFNADGYTIQGEGNLLTLIGPDATLTANKDVTIAASIAGNNGLVIQGTTKTINLTGDSPSLANTYTGGTYIRSGTVILQAAGAQNNGTAYAVDSIEALDAGATVKFYAPFNGTIYDTVRDQIGTHSSTFASHLHMTGGTFDLNDDPKKQHMPVPDGTGLIINTGTNVQSGVIMVADGQDHTFSGVIADGGPLVGDNISPSQGPGRQIGIVSFAASINGGGGVWTLSGSNTYSGSTRIDQGATIKLAGNGTIGFPTASLSFTGPMRVYGPGGLDLNGHNQTIALMTSGNAAGKIYNSAVGTVSTLTFGYGNEQVATRNAGMQFIDNLGTGGILAMKKVATGPAFITPGSGLPATNCTQTLSGVNTYSGDTTVEGGHLIMANATAVSSNSAFRLSTTASPPSPDSSVSLALNYDGTANVRQLWINGVQQPNGVYGVGTPGINPNSIGTLTVTGYAPVSLGASQSGNTLTFAWQGVYKLQSQTNSLSTYSTSTWYDYPGGGTSPVAATINPANSTVFYRLSTY